MILNKNSNMLHGSKEFNFIYIYIFLAFFLHLISVFFSIGFYNDDEHFQILEPTAYLLGLNEILIDKSAKQLSIDYIKNEELKKGVHNVLIYTKDYLIGQGEFLIK